MSLEKPKQPCSIWQVGKQRQEVAFKPPVKSPLSHPFYDEKNGKGDDFA